MPIVGRLGVAPIAATSAAAPPPVVYSRLVTQPAPARPPMPTDLVGMFRADTLSAIADGGQVTSWSDTVGARTLNPGGAAPIKVAAGIGGKATVRFDSTSQWLEMPTSNPATASPITITYVAQLAQTVANNRSITWFTGSGGSTAETGVFDGKWGGYGGTFNSTTNSPPVGNTPYVVVTVFNGANSSITVNGTVVFAGDLGTLPILSGRMVLGNHGTQTRIWPGDISEVRIYQRAFTADDRAAYDSYAQDYYGITVADYVAGGGNDYTGTAAFTGSGSLASAGTPAVVGAANMGGSGSLAATPAPAFLQSATLTGSGALTPAGAPATSGPAASTGTGSLTSAGTPSTLSASTLSGSGALTAAGSPAVTATAAMTGSGALTGSGTGAQNGTAPPQFTGSGALTATGSPRFTRAVAFTGAGTLSATGAPATSGSASLTGSGQLTASGAMQQSRSLAFTGSGNLTSAGAAQLSALANFTGSGQLEALRIYRFDQLTGPVVARFTSDGMTSAEYPTPGSTEATYMSGGVLAASYTSTGRTESAFTADGITAAQFQATGITTAAFISDGIGVGSFAYQPGLSDQAT